MLHAKQLRGEDVAGFGVFRISTDMEANPQAEKTHVLSCLRNRSR